MSRTPKYFFVAFGSEHINHPVDGGIYTHQRGYIENSGISPGHVIILYCTGGYPGHHREAPGIGVVLSVESGIVNGVIKYQYFPLDCSLSLEVAKKTIPELEGKTNFGWSGNWLREIDKSSFSAAMAGRQVNWP